MLEISSEAIEAQLQVDFAEVYATSEIYRLVVSNYQFLSQSAYLLERLLVVITILFTRPQEKSGTRKKTWYSTTRFQGSFFPLQIPPKLYNSMHGLFLETTQVILAKLRIQLYPVRCGNHHWYPVWSCLLEQRRSNVCLVIYL